MNDGFRVALALRSNSILAAPLFFRGAQKFAHTKLDWSLVWNNGTSWLCWDEALKAKPDGILSILSPEQAVTHEAAGGAHVVILNAVGKDCPFHKVTADGGEAGRRGAAHFLEHRLEHFAFAGREGEFYSEQRLEGFREALSAAGHAGPLPVADLKSQDPAYLPTWVKSLPLPCGILCATDAMGMHIILACGDVGLAVPDQVAVLGIGNDETVCRESPITLSSLELNYESVGYRAASLLDDLLHGRPVPDKPVLIPPGRVVARESTRVFGVEDPLVRRALLIIHDQHTEPLTVPILLSRLGNVSRRLLELHFRQFLGRSPYQEILQARVTHAQGLLKNTELSIEEIAAEAGFYDLARFRRQFRGVCKRTPSEYRNLHKTGSSAVSE